MYHIILYCFNEYNISIDMYSFSSLYNVTHSYFELLTYRNSRLQGRTAMKKYE